MAISFTKNPKEDPHLNSKVLSCTSRILQECVCCDITIALSFTSKITAKTTGHGAVITDTSRSPVTS